MPSPFPGMDPYLEDPVRWPNVHHKLISQFSDALNASLPPQYVAVVQERLLVEASGRGIYPDVGVIPTTQPGGATESGVMLADPAWEVDIQSAQTKQGYIEIVHAGDQTRVITTIELLSPGNKVGVKEGQAEYLKKQKEVLESNTHLLEIDLLRGGKHTVSAPLTELLRFGSWDYLASLSRADRRGHWTVWAVTLRQRLPRILVPLEAGASDVVLDLQAALDRVYDLGRFRSLIDYSRDPWPPLEEKDAAWADALLREKRARSTANG